MGFLNLIYAGFRIFYCSSYPTVSFDRCYVVWEWFLLINSSCEVDIYEESWGKMSWLRYVWGFILIYLKSSIIFRGFFLTRTRDTSEFLSQSWTRLELKKNVSIRGWERVKVGLFTLMWLNMKPSLLRNCTFLLIPIRNFIISNKTIK